MVEGSITPSGLSGVARVRAQIYHMLSVLFLKTPDRAIIGMLGKGALLESLLSQFAKEQSTEKMRRGLEGLQSHLETSGSHPWEKFEKETAVEFTRLFRGVKPGYSPPPPYESAYREGAVFGNSTIAILKEYVKHGLAVKANFKDEPPDHLSFELDFLRALCLKEAEALAGGNLDEARRMLEAEGGFLMEHLEAWLPALCVNIRKFDRQGFYGRLAELAEDWIEFDESMIQVYLSAL